MSLPLSLQMPSALDYFSALVARDDDLPLLEAAVALGQDECPDLDIQAVLAEVDGLADRLRRRLPADASGLHRLQMLNRYYFHELGFGGNVNDYEAPENSYLHRVLLTRRGLPISLAVLYMEMAQQIGLVAHGISFPAHFLVKVHLSDGEVVMDPFTGQSLSRHMLDERLEPFRIERGLVGDFEAPLGLFLQAAGHREILARMLGNLKMLWRQRMDWSRLLAVEERLVRLLPDQASERRDRGMTLAELGQIDAALIDLDDYLRRAPDARDHAAVSHRVAALRHRPRPPLH